MALLVSKQFQIYVAFGLALPLCFAACQSDVPSSRTAVKSSQDQLVSVSGQTMGTTYQVKLFDPNHSLSKAEWQQKFGVKLERINQLMSTYLPDSEISRFNSSQSTDWFPISHETLTVITRAQQISELTGGAFDITVGPLVNLWHFGPDKKTSQIPDDSIIQNMLQQIGYQKLEVQNEPPALRKTEPALQCDLSAIAKGYAVDQLCELIEQQQIHNYMVEIGGEVRTAGAKTDGKPWQIGIAAPTENEIALQRMIQMSSQALATSGDYRNFYEKDGKRFSHTIDPQTGKPVQFDLAAVSVLADNCMDADAWATAIMVLGPEAGYHLAVQQNLEVLLLLRADGKVQEKITSGMKQQLLPRQ